MGEQSWTVILALEDSTLRDDRSYERARMAAHGAARALSASPLRATEHRGAGCRRCVDAIDSKSTANADARPASGRLTAGRGVNAACARLSGRGSRTKRTQLATRALRARRSASRECGKSGLFTTSSGATGLPSGPKTPAREETTRGMK